LRDNYPDYAVSPARISSSRVHTIRANVEAHVRRSVILAVALVGFSSLVFCQSTTSPMPMNGTVNIILANKQGLVAVTDSLLSDDRGARAIGKKLFQLDASTICTIAGWYSDPGPLEDDNKYPRPASAVLPDVINLYHYSDLRRATLEQKMERLSSLFTDTLDVVAQIDKATGSPTNPYPLELTLAGFDAGHLLRIIEVDLVLNQVGTKWQYEQKNYTVIEVTNKLVSVVRGIKDVAQPILDNPKPDHRSDPILQHYSEAMASDNGESLSLDDMKLIAKRLEALTADKFNRKVGGERQVALLTNGAVLQPIEQPPSYARLDGFSHLIFRQLSKMQAGYDLSGIGVTLPFSYIGH
jgi:hypothetical protein